MEDMIDNIYEQLKDNQEFRNLSLDQQGEFCMKLSKLLFNYFGGENC